jgi:hypothetical protein
MFFVGRDKCSFQGRVTKMFEKAKRIGLAVGGAALCSAPVAALADGTLTMPTIDNSTVYTAGTAVLAIVAIIVGIGLTISVFRKAGGR